MPVARGCRLPFLNSVTRKHAARPTSLRMHDTPAQAPTPVTQSGMHTQVCASSGAKSAHTIAS
jgi:hypothetical protein